MTRAAAPTFTSTSADRSAITKKPTVSATVRPTVSRPWLASTSSRFGPSTAASRSPTARLSTSSSSPAKTAWSRWNAHASWLTARIGRDPEAFAALLPYLTIQVSDLFRDPEYFRVLRDRIAPVLATYPSRRIWVAGCGAGEEAYSVAIVLREEGLAARTRIYATDIHAPGLEAGAEGVYPIARVPAFAANHRRTGARIALSLHPRIVLTDVVLSNAPWGTAKELARIERLELAAALLPLLSRRFELTEMCSIHCVRLFKDTAGWVPVYRENPPPG